MTTTATTHHQDLPHLALFLQLGHNTEFNAKVLPALYITTISNVIENTTTYALTEQGAEEALTKFCERLLMAMGRSNQLATSFTNLKAIAQQCQQHGIQINLEKIINTAHQNAKKYHAFNHTFWAPNIDPTFDALKAQLLQPKPRIQQEQPAPALEG